MKTFYPEREREEMVAGIGSAQLVRSCDGRFHLRGGTDEDRKQLLAWVKQFVPEWAPSLLSSARCGNALDAARSGGYEISVI